MCVIGKNHQGVKCLKILYSRREEVVRFHVDALASYHQCKSCGNRPLYPTFLGSLSVDEHDPWSPQVCLSISYLINQLIIWKALVWTILEFQNFITIAAVMSATVDIVTPLLCYKYQYHISLVWAWHYPPTWVI